MKLYGILWAFQKEQPKHFPKNAIEQFPKKWAQKNNPNSFPKHSNNPQNENPGTWPVRTR